MLQKLKSIFLKPTAKATDNSVAVAGDSHAPITIATGFSEKQLQNLSDQTQHGFNEIHKRLDFPAYIPEGYLSPTEVNDLLGKPIDVIAQLIYSNPQEALIQFEGLYQKIAASSNNITRFRIKANMGICHYQLGDIEAAAQKFLDAHTEAVSRPDACAYRALALIFQKKPDEAFSYAREQLKLDPNNHSLAGYLLQSAATIKDKIDPECLISEHIRDKKEVIVGLIHFHQIKKNERTWRDIAYQNYPLHAQDNLVACYFSQATIEDTLENKEFRQQNLLSEENREKVTCAVALLKNLWAKIWQTNPKKLNEQQEIIGIYLLLGNFILQDDSAIKSFSTEVNISSCEPQQLLENIGKYSFLMKDFENAKLALEKIKKKSATTHFYLFSLNVVQEEAKQILATEDSVIDTFPKGEVIWCRLFKKLTLLETNPQPLKESDFKDLDVFVFQDIRSMIMLSEKAGEHGLLQLSQTYFDLAFEATTEKSDHFERLIVAQKAASKQEWHKVIHLFETYSFEAQISNPNLLRMLAHAHAHRTPTHSSSVAFFNALPESLLTHPEIGLLFGKLLYDLGELDEAELKLAYLNQQTPNNLNILLALCLTYLRKRDEKSIRNLFQEINLQKLEGTSKQKVDFAQLYADFSNTQEALNFAYSVLCESKQCPETLMAYFGLIMQRKNGDIELPEIIHPGDWFHIISDDGEELKTSIDDGAVTYVNEPLERNHPISREVIGRGVGDTFYISRKFAETKRKWEVKSIKSKYIHAYHDIMSDFATRFPSHYGFEKYIIKDDDFSFLFDQVKEKAENTQLILKQYSDKSLPLNVITNFLKTNVITTAVSLINSGQKIISNIGNREEFEQKLTSLESGNYSAVVLDTYTAWVLANNELLPLLKHIYNKVLIPRAALLEIENLNRYTPHTQPQLTLFYQDGQYYKEAISEKSQKKAIQQVQKILNVIQSNCEVITVTYETPLDKKMQSLIDTLDAPFLFDPIYLAQTKNAILASEDLFYRRHAAYFFPDVQSFCVQHIFNYAVNHQKITEADYAKLIVALINSGHSYVYFDVNVLLTLFQEAQNCDDLTKFQIVIDRLGSKNMDIASHVSVALFFLKQIWMNIKVYDPIRLKATNLVVEKILRHSGESWSTVMAYFLLQTQRNVLLHESIKKWITGHFLSQVEIEQKLEWIINMSTSEFD